VEAVGVLLGSLFEPFVLFTIFLVPLEEEEEEDEEKDEEEEEEEDSFISPTLLFLLEGEVTNCDDLLEEGNSYNCFLSILFSPS
jgi:hypothetical protein